MTLEIAQQLHHHFGMSAHMEKAILVLFCDGLEKYQSGLCSKFLNLEENILVESLNPALRIATCLKFDV